MLEKKKSGFAENAERKSMSSRLKDKYQKEVAPELIRELSIKNKMATPKVTKVVVNMGIGEIGRSKELKESLTKDLATITGQVPGVKLAKVSIASFNLRRGMPVGLAVTLRGLRMYDFMDKLFSIVLPRLRDFRGIPRKGMDKQGNYSLGLSEHTIFPEIDVTKTQGQGIEITFVTNTKNPEVSEKLLTLLGMPFEKEAK